MSNNFHFTETELINLINNGDDLTTHGFKQGNQERKADGKFGKKIGGEDPPNKSQGGDEEENKGGGSDSKNPYSAFQRKRGDGPQSPSERGSFPPTKKERAEEALSEAEKKAKELGRDAETAAQRALKAKEVKELQEEGYKAMFGEKSNRPFIDKVAGLLGSAAWESTKLGVKTLGKGVKFMAQRYGDKRSLILGAAGAAIAATAIGGPMGLLALQAAVGHSTGAAIGGATLAKGMIGGAVGLNEVSKLGRFLVSRLSPKGTNDGVREEATQQFVAGTPWDKRNKKATTNAEEEFNELDEPYEYEDTVDDALSDTPDFPPGFIADTMKILTKMSRNMKAATPSRERVIELLTQAEESTDSSEYKEWLEEMQTQYGEGEPMEEDEDTEEEEVDEEEEMEDVEDIEEVEDEEDEEETVKNQEVTENFWSDAARKAAALARRGASAVGSGVKKAILAVPLPEKSGKTRRKKKMEEAANAPTPEMPSKSGVDLPSDDNDDSTATYATRRRKGSAREYRRTFASKSHKPSWNSEMARNKFTHSDKIDWLTTNCDCWKDREGSRILALMSETRVDNLFRNAVEKVYEDDLVSTLNEINGENLSLNELSDFVRNNLTSNGCDSENIKKKSMEHIVDEETVSSDDEMNEARKKRNKQVFGTNKENDMAKTMNMKEWLENAPPEGRAALNHAMEIELRERTSLVEHMTANVSNAETKKALTEFLMSKKLPELKKLSLLAANNKKDTAPSYNPNYYFNGGAPTSNALVESDEEVLALPTMNSYKD